MNVEKVGFFLKVSLGFRVVQFIFFLKMGKKFFFLKMGKSLTQNTHLTKRTRQSCLRFKQIKKFICE